MDRKEEMALRRLQRQANQETDRAMETWGPFSYADRHGYDFEIGMTVLIEELGKISRAHFKETIALDPDVKQQWRTNLAASFVKFHSILNRIYLDRIEGRRPEQ